MTTPAGSPLYDVVITHHDRPELVGNRWATGTWDEAARWARELEVSGRLYHVATDVRPAS